MPLSGRHGGRGAGASSPGSQRCRRFWSAGRGPQQQHSQQPRRRRSAPSCASGSVPPGLWAQPAAQAGGVQLPHLQVGAACRRRMPPLPGLPGLLPGPRLSTPAMCVPWLCLAHQPAADQCRRYCCCTLTHTFEHPACLPACLPARLPPRRSQVSVPPVCGDQLRAPLLRGLHPRLPRLPRVRRRHQQPAARYPDAGCVQSAVCRPEWSAPA